MNDSAHETDDNDNKINKTMLSKSFEYKTKIIGGTPNNNILDAEVVVSLKYFSKFWTSLISHWLTVKFNLSWDGEKIV